MPAKMMSEMPLPMPRLVICSPIHMSSIVPLVSVSMVERRKNQPGFITTFAVCSSPMAMPSAWIAARPTVP